MRNGQTVPLGRYCGSRGPSGNLLMSSGKDMSVTYTWLDITRAGSFRIAYKFLTSKCTSRSACLDYIKARMDHTKARLDHTKHVWITPKRVWIPPRRVWIKSRRVWITSRCVWITSRRVWIPPRRVYITPMWVSRSHKSRHVWIVGFHRAVSVHSKVVASHRAVSVHSKVVASHLAACTLF